MKKLKKILNLTLIFAIIMALFLFKSTYAESTSGKLEKVEYSEEFKSWLALSNEEKQNVIMPRIYDVKAKSNKTANVFYNLRLLGASLENNYSLKTIIPNNVIIRNQQNTNSCWAFASISSLETNLALYNYKNGINTDKVYNYSERHLEYADSKNFANDTVNENGYNRNVGDGGNWYIAESYLTNGMGAIDENEMPFENNEDIIDISQIQNKDVTSQVYDTVYFADYQKLTGSERTEVMNEIKKHIQNYGAVYAPLHGASSSSSGYSDCYNNDTGAKYCKSTFGHSPDHAISIIGWDDTYSVENFVEGSRPSAAGAWIIRNSWGEREEHNLEELKEYLFSNYQEQCIQKGWNSAEEIPNSFFEEAGYTIEGDIAYVEIGDNGLMYVSYEDCNISTAMCGIEKATDIIDYDNIYQYDYYFPGNSIGVQSSTAMICNIFTKKTSGTEYLNQIALNVNETCTCKVYVNPNNASKDKNSMQLVQLKAGETETINAGYHTLEFSAPVEIKGSQFAVLVVLEGTGNSLIIPTESKIDGVETFDNVTVENNKCFMAISNNIENAEWVDMGQISSIVSTLDDCDSTIKAFTTTELIDESLKNIEIVTPPNKTSYFEGEDFDKTGMVVQANFNSRKNPSVILDESSYTIDDGTNLEEGQTKVTIEYNGKTADQTITVERNSVTNLEIETPPNKTEYKEGKNFETDGMVIKATYKDGTTKPITDYTVVDGNNLKENQTEVTISYDGQTVKQTITVIPNPLIRVEITKAPNKTEYVVGQDFDATGMVVTGTFQDEETEEIIDYTIENGTNLTKEQTSVTIKYGTHSAEQVITVVEKAVTKIEISKMPNKTKYIQNNEGLDISDAKIKVTYNDGTTEEISLDSDSVKVTGFNNKVLGENTITVEYESKTTTFNVEIIEDVKPENSEFSNSKSAINKIQYYQYVNPDKEEYVVINVTVSNITKNTSNDSYEYYYYISSNANESNIVNWVKISGSQIKDGKLQFTINSKDIANYADISDENDLYLYIKEVVTLNGNQSTKVSSAMQLKSNSNTETEVYVDDKKLDMNIDDVLSSKENKDSTTAPKQLPNTGLQSVLIIISVIVVIGTVAYIRYRYLNKYVK